MTYDLPPLGDPITIVFKDHVYQTKVVDGRALRSQFLVNYNGDDRTLTMGDENIEWLRGFHALDSEAVQAAQAARALTIEEKPKAKPKKPPPALQPNLPPPAQQIVDSWGQRPAPYFGDDDGEKMRRELWQRSKLGGGGRRY